MRIYLIKDGENRCKIGFSKNPIARLKQLQTAGATKFELIYDIECEYASKVEHTIHRLLNRHRRNGEWFDLPDEDVENFSSLVRQVETNIKSIIENSTLKNPI